MKAFETKDIRNLVLVGHGGSGKTSLAEAFLFDGKGTNRLGVAGTEQSNFDYEPEEVRRQGTIQTSMGYIEYKKHKINFIDTPGDQSFLVETRVALKHGGDIATIVVSCPDGVQVVTEKVWQAAGDMPRVIFVNKMDRERADWERCLAEIKEVLSEKASPLWLPMGQESGFVGVVDLLALKAYTFSDEGRQVEVGDVPGDMKDAVNAAREKLIEDIASSNDELLEKYLGTGELSEEEITRGLQSAILAGTLVPVFCGSATKNIGVASFLDFVVSSTPSPDQLPPVKGADGSDRPRSPDQPLCGRVFKTMGADIGKISLFRVLSGKLSSDSTVLNTAKDKTERTGSLYVMVGKKRETVPEAPAGDIVGLAKLKLTKTGDVLCDEKAPFNLPELDVPPSLIKFAVKPKSKADEDKMGQRLHDLQDEDVALRVERDPVSKDILLCGMGQSHIEASVEKLKRMGIEVELLPPKIPYLETIKGKVQNVEGKHKKQSGGRGQFGVCYVHVEALPRGGGFEFVDAIVGGAIPRQFIPAVEKGMRDRMEMGIVAGYPVTDIKVTLFDGKYHDVDSDSRSFEMAGSKAIREAVKKAKAVLLEPIMEMEVVCPEENMGDIMGDVSSRRGKVLGSEQRGKNMVIKAQIPMSESLKYEADLRSMTGGRGSFSMQFSHYDELPGHLAEKVIAESKVVEEED